MDAWMHGYMYKYVQNIHIYIYTYIYVCHKSEFVALEKKKIVLLVYWGSSPGGWALNPLKPCRKIL